MARMRTTYKQEMRVLSTPGRAVWLVIGAMGRSQYTEWVREEAFVEA